MGMQNTRALLPEQIDNLINTSAMDVVTEVIRMFTGDAGDRTIRDSVKLEGVNSLSTLCKVKTFNINGSKVSSYGNKPYIINLKDYFSDVTPICYTDFSIAYSNGMDILLSTYDRIRLASAAKYEELSKEWHNYFDGSTIDRVPSPEKDITYYSPVIKYFKDYYDKSISLLKSNNVDTSAFNVFPEAHDYLTGSYNIIAHLNDVGQLMDLVNSALETNITYTNLFPIRIIENYKLSDTINDYIQSPRMRSPIMVIYDGDSDEYNGGTIELYFGDNKENGLSEVADKKYVSQLRCFYIKKPNEVKFVSDFDENNVNLDLPEQLHIPVLKHAVDLYRASLQGNLFTAQENARLNQQDAIRNSDRPYNDSYQQ
jgi:hypothetical protein